MSVSKHNFFDLAGLLTLEFGCLQSPTNKYGVRKRLISTFTNYFIDYNYYKPLAMYILL